MQRRCVPHFSNIRRFLRGVSFRCRRGVNSGCRLTVAGALMEKRTMAEQWLADGAAFTENENGYMQPPGAVDQMRDLPTGSILSNVWRFTDGSVIVEWMRGGGAFEYAIGRVVDAANVIQDEERGAARARRPSTAPSRRAARAPVPAAPREARDPAPLTAPSAPGKPCFGRTTPASPAGR